MADAVQGDAGARALGFNDYADYQNKMAAMNAGSGGSGGSFGISIPNFNFDWTAAEKQALDQLRPYYQQVLNLNNGDVNRAKQAIEADYQSGKRYREGELTGQLTQENQAGQDENKKTLDDLNSRGVLFQETAPGEQQNQAEGVDQTANGVGTPNPTFGNRGGMGYSALATNQYFDPLLDKQAQRRAAIQRAIQNQSEIANTNYTKDLGDQTSKGQSNQLDVGKQMQGEAQQIATQQYNTGAQKSQFAAQNALDASNSLLPGQNAAKNILSGV